MSPFKNIKMKRVLKSAIEKGDIKAVKQVFSTGFHKQKVINEFLIISIQKERYDIIQILLDNGAEIGDGLHIASKNGNIEIAKLLINAKADVNKRNENGDFPLLLALRHAFDPVAICEFLLENGASLNIADRKGKKPVHELIKKFPKLSIELFNLFIKYNLDINFYAKNNNEILKKALDNKNYNFFYLLLQRGFDINYKEEKGKDTIFQTLLNYYAFGGDVETLKILISNGADISIRDDFGHSALFYALRKDLGFDNIFGSKTGKIELKTAKVLLDSGARLDFHEATDLQDMAKMNNKEISWDLKKLLGW